MGRETRKVESGTKDKNVIVALGISIFAIFVMLLLSLRIHKKVPTDAKFPMHWGIDGKVTWRGSKTTGILLMPLLPSTVLFPFCLVYLIPDIKSDPTSRIILHITLIFVALILFATHAAYVHFAVRDIEKNASK